MVMRRDGSLLHVRNAVSLFLSGRLNIYTRKEREAMVKKKKKGWSFQLKMNRIAGFILVLAGIAVIFVSAVLNTLQNHDFRPGTETANQAYMLDLISTLGVLLIPGGLYLLLKKEEPKIPLPGDYCTISGMDEAHYSYMRWN